MANIFSAIVDFINKIDHIQIKHYDFDLSGIVLTLTSLNRFQWHLEVVVTFSWTLFYSLVFFIH